jgi:hypothetical protein
MLQVTPRGVRWLADVGRLPAERTLSGQRLFRLSDVQRLVEQRALARIAPRAARLQSLRVRMLKTELAPRQLSLRLPLVELHAVGERSLPHAEVKGAEIRSKRA